MAALASGSIAQEVIPTWGTPALWYPGSFPFGIDAGDGMGSTEQDDSPDGFPDVVVAVGEVSFVAADLPDSYTGADSSILVYRNTQDWAPASDGLDLAHTIFLPDYTIAAEVIWADVSGDARLDIVCTTTHHYDPDLNHPQYEGDWGVYVYVWSNQFQQFEPYQYVASTYPLRGLSADDFDDDGDTDVVAAVDWPEPGGIDRDQLSVYWNQGGTPGSYTLASESVEGPLGSAGSYPTAQLVSGAFDKTHTYPDLFTPLYDLDAVLLKGSASGFTDSLLSFSSCEYVGATGLASGKFVLGKTTDDIAAAGNGQLYVYRANGLGAFNHNCGNEPNDIYFDGGCCGSELFLYPYDVATGHLNGGTKPDLVFSTPTGGVNARIWMLLGKGDGKFQFQQTSTYFVPLDDGSGDTDYPVRVVVADMDQDGFGDVITSNHGSVAFDGTISVVINGLSILP